MKSAKATKSMVAATSIGLLAFGLAACGGGGGGQGNATADCPHGVTNITASLFASADEVPQIAQEKGYFAKHCLNVSFIDQDSNATAVAQLTSGQAQVANVGGITMIESVAQGIPVKIFLAQNRTLGPGAQPLAVKAGSPIKSYKDLVGKTVALQGTLETTQLSVSLTLEAHGINPASVKMIKVPLPNIINAVKTGQVDAGDLIGSYAQLAAADPQLRVIGDPGWEAIPGAPGTAWGVAKGYAASHMDIINAFSAAIKEATGAALANNGALIRAWDLANTDQDPNFVKTMKLLGYAYQISKSGIAREADGLRKLGWIKKTVSWDDIVLAGINPAYVVN